MTPSVAETQGGGDVGPGSVGLVTLARERGGVWRHVEDLATGLMNAGVDVRIGLRPDAVALQDACGSAELPWEPLDRSVRSTCDVWHLHLGDSFSRFAVRLLAARRGLGPAVITEHLPRTVASDPALEPQIPRHRGAHLAKTAFKRVEFALTSKVIAVSPGSAAFLAQRYALRRTKLITVPNGLVLPQTAKSHRNHEDSHRMHIVTVGSLIRQKGHDVLVEAARRSTWDWTVTIVGSGVHEDTLARQAAAMPAGRVRLLGWLDNPLEELASADLACMPSRWEAFGYAALEAAGLGLPVVATAVDGLEDIVVDGRTGVLVPPNDPQALANALDDLATRPRSELRQMGEAGRARALDCFGLDQMVRGTLEAYRQATGKVVRSRAERP